MRRVGPHLMAIGGALLCVWAASALREAGARVAASQLTISWWHYGGALALWAVTGFLLALPSLLAAAAAGRKLRLDWAVLMPYLAPGLLFALALPWYMVAPFWGLTWPPTMWIPSFVKYGGDMFGCLLVGYGVGLSLTPGGMAAGGDGGPE